MSAADKSPVSNTPHEDQASARRQGELETIIRTAMDGFWIVDMQGRFLRVNDAYCEMTGFSEEELRSMAVSDVEAVESQVDTAAHIQKVMSTGKDRFESRHRTKQGALLHVEVSTQYLAGPPGRLFAFVRDISALKAAEARQRAAEQQLQQARKMEALGTLAGGIAHDFNNILGAVVGNVELSLLHAPPGTELHENLVQISLASVRARDLVRQILAFSRASDETPRPLALEPIIRETLKLLRATVPSTIEVEWVGPAQPVGPVLATPTHVHQVVMNLGTNAYHAVKATGGTVRFSLARVALGNDDAARLGVRPGEFACLACEDDGPGIPPEIVHRVLEPFFTTRTQGEGTGLGLSVVHGIATANGGAVEVDASPRRGALLRVLLPVVAAAPDVVLPAPAPVRPTLAGKVLVVDDEVALATVMGRMLTRLGMEATTCNRPDVALDLLGREPRAFDLVVTDQTMPGMTGVELLRRARNAGVVAPVVVCTGHSDALAGGGAERLGFAALLRKPLTMADVGQTVSAVLRRP